MSGTDVGASGRTSGGAGYVGGAPAAGSSGSEFSAGSGGTDTLGEGGVSGLTAGGSSGSGGSSAAGGGSGAAGGPILPPGVAATPLCANLARTATAEAESVFPGYRLEHVIDGSRSTTLGSADSWTNLHDAPNGLVPQWFDLDFGRRRSIARVEIYTSSGYAIQNYDLLYWGGTEWKTIASVTGNVLLHRSHEFPSVSTDRLRVLGRRGPENQAWLVRLNEVEVYSASLADCASDPNAGETPTLIPIEPARSDTTIDFSELACIPLDPVWSCTAFKGKTDPNCSYRNWQASRQFESTPTQDGTDARVWPGNLVRNVDATGAGFETWPADRAPLSFTLTYASSHSVESGSMSPASASNFLQELERMLAKRRTAPIGRRLEVEIAPLRSAEEFSTLTGHSPTTEPSELDFIDFGATGGRSTVLMTLTARAFDVDIAPPSSVAQVLAGGASDPALGDAGSVASAAMVQQVSFGKQRFLLVDDVGSFDEVAAFLIRVVSSVRGGFKGSLSGADVRHFAKITERGIGGVDGLESFLKGLDGNLGPTSVISYRLKDFKGNVVPRKVSTRFVEATCNDVSQAFEFTLSNVAALPPSTGGAFTGSVKIGRQNAQGTCTPDTAASEGHLSFAWKGTPIRVTFERRLYQPGESLCLSAAVQNKVGTVVQDYGAAAVSIPFGAGFAGDHQLDVSSAEGSARLTVTLLPY
jgi:hypothetical protein